MYKITEEQKEQIHKALIVACDNGTFDEFTKEELKQIESAEKLVNNLTIPVVSNNEERVAVCPDCNSKDTERTGETTYFCHKCKCHWAN